MRRALLALASMAAVAHPAPDDAILRLLAEDLDGQMRRSPVWASMRGDRRFDDRLEDVGPGARAAWLEECRGRLAALSAIDREALTPAGRIHAALLEYELRARIENARFHPEQTPVTQMHGPQIDLPQLPERLSFPGDQELAAYASRLEAVAGYIDGTIANLRSGLAAGRTPPRVVMGRVAEQALAQGAEAFAADPDRHPMLLPFRDRPEGDALAARARDALREGVLPAFRRLGAFLRDDYVPGCRASIAASDGPDGRAYYDLQLAHHTTLSLGAEEIHALGIAEVARIRSEMARTIARTDFPRRDALAGEELFAAFLEFLRTDPRFYCTQAQELLAGYRDIAKRVDAELPHLFGRLPRLPYGVREMPLYMAPAAPTAYYYRGSIENGIPGYFIANTWRLDQRPRYEMVALTLHEAVPGHHLQIALAQEMEGQPEWRETLGYTAYVEGWALYAERLGLEMPGLYEDPYDDFGRLTYEMWRAMRLVVDTGLHAKGWSRDRAIAYMLANSGLSRENVEREVDRYIAWPGQAVAYKIGELRIRALRERAQKALGARFSLRAFHDALLEEGALPLPVLEAKIDRWIAER
ncbi:MAG: DUF885 domain-containing protein [Planctomycetaceae bacterium]